MELRTCEEYVIAELGRAQLEIELLNKENADLRQDIGRLEGELAKRDTPIERHIAAEGRMKTLCEVAYPTCTPARRGNETLTFEQWCNDVMVWYTEMHERRYDMGSDEFMRYFEPELRAAYDMHLEELREDGAE